MNIPTQQLNEETRQFWCITSEVRKLCRESTSPRQADEVILFHLEELETMVLHSQQPWLVKKCKAFIAEFTATERTPAAFG